MKKILEKLFLLALSVILIFCLSACGGNMNNNSSDDYVSSNDSQSPVESILDPSKNESTNAKITRDEAKKIALKDAALNESDVRDLEIELDRENDTLVYEISFEKDYDDFDYVIDANSGKIISKDKEKID